MEWRKYENEISYFQNMSIDEKAAIIKSGIETEFWRLLRSTLANTLKTLETNLIRTRVNSLDDTVRLARFAEAYKSVEEVLGIPEMFLKSQILAQKTPQSVKKGD